MKKLFLGILLVGMSSPNMMNSSTCDIVKGLYSDTQAEFNEVKKNCLMKNGRPSSVREYEILYELKLVADSYNDILIGCNTQWNSAEDRELGFPGKTEEEAKIIIMRRNIADFRKRGKKLRPDMPVFRQKTADSAGYFIDGIEKNFKAQAQDKTPSEQQ